MIEETGGNYLPPLPDGYGRMVPEVSEQPLTASEEANLRDAWARTHTSSGQVIRRIFATLDATRAGVPGDEGLRAAALELQAALDAPFPHDEGDEQKSTTTIEREWSEIDLRVAKARKALRKALAASPAPVGLDALRAAAQDIVDRSALDQDSEGLGSEWCHYCETFADYPKGKTVEKHADWCPLAALRAALASPDSERPA